MLPSEARERIRRADYIDHKSVCHLSVEGGVPSRRSRAWYTSHKQSRVGNTWERADEIYAFSWVALLIQGVQLFPGQGSSSRARAVSIFQPEGSCAASLAVSMVETNGRKRTDRQPLRPRTTHAASWT
jgi:hypothetical protein